MLNLNTAERPWIAGTVFGVLTLIAAALIYTLPDTRNLPLTQTLQEAEVKLRQLGSPNKDDEVWKEEKETDHSEYL